MLLRQMTEQEIIAYLIRTKPAHTAPPKLRAHRAAALDEIDRRTELNLTRK